MASTSSSTNTTSSLPSSSSSSSSSATTTAPIPCTPSATALGIEGRGTRGKGQQSRGKKERERGDQRGGGGGRGGRGRDKERKPAGTTPTGPSASTATAATITTSSAVSSATTATPTTSSTPSSSVPPTSTPAAPSGRRGGRGGGRRADEEKKVTAPSAKKAMPSKTALAAQATEREAKLKQERDAKAAVDAVATAERAKIELEEKKKREELERIERERKEAEDKIRKEEEEKARKAAEEEEARLEEQRRIEEEEEAKRQLNFKIEMRAANLKAFVSRPGTFTTLASLTLTISAVSISISALSPSHPSFPFPPILIYHLLCQDVGSLKADASHKKNTTFVKKLRAITEENKESIFQEFFTLNLSRYITEAIAALVEAPIKITQIPTIVKLCSLLHQRYSEFSTAFILALRSTFASAPPVKGAPPETEQERAAKFTRKRIVLRILSELLIVAVYTDFEVVFSIVQDLCNSDNLKEPGYHILALVVSFVRSNGEEFLGLTFKKDKLSGPLQLSLPEDGKLTPPERKKALLRIVLTYYDRVAGHLSTEHKGLQEREKENHRILETRGELTDATASTYEKSRKSYEKLLNTTTTFSELVGKDLPELVEEHHTTRIASVTVDVGGVSKLDKDKEANALESSIWDDEDTKSFYENLPDLRILVPAVLLGGEEKKAANANGSVGGITLDQLLGRLSNCVNRDLIDQAALDFCYVNSKSNRKKLVKVLFGVPR
jgi:hypothetical protein